MGLGVVVVRVDLDGDVGLRVDDLHEEREAIALGIAEEVPSALPELRERLAAAGTLLHRAIAMGMGADGPALAHGAVGDRVAELAGEAPSSPDVVVNDGFENDEVPGGGVHARPFASSGSYGTDTAPRTPYAAIRVRHSLIAPRRSRDRDVTG